MKRFATALAIWALFAAICGSSAAAEKVIEVTGIASQGLMHTS